MKLELAGGVRAAAATCRSIFAFRFVFVCVSSFFFKLSQFYLHRRYALNALCICFFIFGSFVFLSYFEYAASI